MIDIKTLGCGPKHLVLRAIAAHRDAFMGEKPRAIYMSQDAVDDLLVELSSDGEGFAFVGEFEGLVYCGTQIRVGNAGGFPFMLCMNGAAYTL